MLWLLPLEDQPSTLALQSEHDSDRTTQPEFNSQSAISSLDDDERVEIRNRPQSISSPQDAQSTQKEEPTSSKISSSSTQEFDIPKYSSSHRSLRSSNILTLLVGVIVGIMIAVAITKWL